MRSGFKQNEVTQPKSNAKQLGNLGIVGATGLIGQALLELIAQAGGPPPRCFASQASVGKPCKHGQRLEALGPGCFEGLSCVLLCTPAEVSKDWVPEALAAGCRVIDGSSAFRLDAQAALIIPEVNGSVLDPKQRLICSPNCVTTLALLALEPLRQLWGLRALSVCSYQAASGAGRALQQQLLEEQRTHGYEHSQPNALLFNLWAHIGDLGPDGYTKEEAKLRDESRKILQNPQLAVSATCVRVPTLRTHALVVEAEFAQACDLKQAQKAFESAPIDFFAQTPPTPVEYAHRKACAVARLRQHPDIPQRMSLYALGDQILKGGALNMFQILCC